MARDFSLIGVGLYSVPEARRLTKIPAATINRWVRGYARRRDSERVQYPALVSPELPEIDDEVAVSFRDLMELRFINRLRQLEIPWREIKLTVETARDLYKTPHPFGTRRFAADGRKVFAKIDRAGTLMRANQLSFEEMFQPSLFAELEYEGGEVARWRPEAGSNIVVLDPARSFGKPLVDEFGIPTAALAAAVAAEGDVERVADWYDVPERVVQIAVAYEQHLLAAA